MRRAKVVNLLTDRYTQWDYEDGENGVTDLWAEVKPNGTLGFMYDKDGETHSHTYNGPYDVYWGSYTTMED